MAVAYGMPAPVVQTQIVVQTQPAHLIRMEREWATGLCGCCDDCCSCFMAFMFPQCYTCYLATEMNENCCVGCCTPAALVALRTKMRTKEGIRGGICTDTCLYANVAVHWLALSQLGREVKMVKLRQGGIF